MEFASSICNYYLVRAVDSKRKVALTSTKLEIGLNFDK
jgi:hypothetical protein